MPPCVSNRETDTDPDRSDSSEWWSDSDIERFEDEDSTEKDIDATDMDGGEDQDGANE